MKTREIIHFSQQFLTQDQSLNRKRSLSQLTLSFLSELTRVDRKRVLCHSTATSDNVSQLLVLSSQLTEVSHASQLPVTFSPNPLGYTRHGG